MSGSRSWPSRVAVTAGLVLVTWGWLACGVGGEVPLGPGGKPDSSTAEPSVDIEPTVEKGFCHEQVEGGKLVLRVEGKAATVLPDGTFLLMEPHLQKFPVDEEEDGAWELEGNRARWNEKTGAAHVEGDVRLHFPNGAELLAEDLNLSQGQDRLWTNRPVSIRFDGSHVHGSTLDASFDTERVILTNVTGTILVSRQPRERGER